ncbi:hypothetical protein [Pannonibacter sp. SL95]|uniref:hypothetical protein n=1 Tax=Pannonibacter sp. SL95 TaxID=2995153 RepID=UPI002274690B|nr:hypothetical protein [Pannonibacter sp. SL95]MCY1708348.1 hypothetical protein [Pannonibacter sp. SL95]
MATEKNTVSAALKLIDGEDNITKAIESVKRRGATLQRDIHILACSVLAHLGKNGDTRVVDRFVAGMIDAMPEMARINALREWFETFGPVSFKDNKPVYQRDGKTRLGDAMAQPFWRFQPEKAYVPLDVTKFVDQALSKLAKDAKQTGRDHSALLAHLQAAKVELAQVAN